MNWQEKYFEIALKALEAGRNLQWTIDHSTNVTRSVATKQARKIAHDIADELDRLHDMEVIYKPSTACQICGADPMTANCNNANCSEKEPF